MATKFVLAPVFHIVFRDSLGQPAANGTVETFLASSLVDQKAVFEDEAGEIPFPNPIDLNAAGVVANALGVPKPIYWADDADYFIEVKDCDGNVIQTIDNYNAPSSTATPGATDVDLTNYLLNPQFRFFIQQEFDSDDPIEGNELPENTETLIANEGWFFDRNNNNSTMKITFETFDRGQTDVPNFPITYLRQQTTNIGAAGESIKDVVFPMKGVGSFADSDIVISFRARAQNTGDAGTIILSYEQDFGTGGSPSTNRKIVIDNVILTTSWSTVTKTVKVQDIIGTTLGTNDDDRFLIRVTYPLDQVSRIDLENMQMNRGEALLEFDYRTFELEASQKRALTLPDPDDEDIFGKIKWDGVKYIIDNETGKVESFMLGDIPDGFLELDGSTFVRTDKVGSTKVKYDRLYQKWEADSQILNGNAFGYGSDGFYPMIYTTTSEFTSTNSATTFSWADNNTGFAFTKLRTAGTFNFSQSLKYRSVFEQSSEVWKTSMTFRITNSANGASSDVALGTVPATDFIITKLQDGGASVPEITDIRIIRQDSFLGVKDANLYFTVDSPATSYYVWFRHQFTSADPAPGGKTKIEVLVDVGDTMYQIINKLKVALEATNDFDVSVPVAIELVNDDEGSVTDSVNVSTIFDIFNGYVKSATSRQVSYIIPVAASAIAASQYFEFDSPTTTYYVWYLVDGAGADPTPVGRTGIKVSILSTDTQFLVALRTKQALDNLEVEKIVFNAASTLSGGEYFLVNNNTTNFYAWYDIDDGSTDPDVSGRTAIEIDITAADTAAQVSEKTRKAISSYFIEMPDAQGYFLKNWSNGSANEVDSLIRLDRGDGTIGDIIGSYQDSDTGSHQHQPDTDGGGFITTFGAGAGPGAGGGGSRQLTNPGIADTKPQNINVLYCIKF